MRELFQEEILSNKEEAGRTQKKSKRRNGIRRIVKEEKKRNRKNSYRASWSKDPLQKSNQQGFWRRDGA